MGDVTMVPHSVMQSQINASVLAERERCALVAGAYGFEVPAARLFAGEIAKAIRRGRQEAPPPQRYSSVPDEWV